MKVSMIASIFYTMVLVAGIAGLYKIKKSNKVQYGAVWIPVSALLLTFYQCLLAAIFSIVHIPVNIVSVGIGDFVLSIVLWFFIVKKKKIQSYQYEKVDVGFLIFLVVMVALFAKQRYGLDLHIHYQTIDPAQHLKNAMDMIKEQRVTAMFYASFHNGLLIQWLAPLRKASQYYQIYVLGDILHFLLAGFTFYAVIRRYMKDNYLKAAAFFVGAVYLFGYPANSTIFGFSYLGMCVTIIACTIIITDAYIHEEITKWLGITFLSLCCLGVFECYVLFMPVVFFSVFFCVLRNQKKLGKLISLDTVKVCLGIFLVPTFLGLYFTYLGIFGSGDTTVGSAIAQEGGIYKDLFSNFALLLPIALFGYYHLYKEKKNWIILYLFPCLVLFLLGLFSLGMSGRVSSYYFYKNYYLLWLIVFILAFAGILYIEKGNRILLFLCAIIWFGIAHVGTMDIEDRIEHMNPQFVVNSNSNAYCDIFIFNRDALFNAAYPFPKVQLYQYAMENLSDTKEYIPLAGGFEDYFWMEAVTGQRNSDFRYWDEGTDSFFQRLQKVEYVMVLKDGDIYLQYPEYFDSLDKVYENDLGYIAKIDKTKEIPGEKDDE